MFLKSASKWIVIFSTLMIWVIKLFLRHLSDHAPVTDYFLGVAPNFIGSFSLVFGAYWLFEKYFFLFRSMTDLKLQMALFFLLLVFNELLQKIPYFGRTFDWNDILFSAFGLFLSYRVFGKLYKKTLINPVSG
jgi:hypothetical protein